MSGKVIAVCNQKGGVGKTTLTLNLGAALTRMGKNVLLIDCDPQANLTMGLGHQSPDELPVTLPHVMDSVIKNGGRTDNLIMLNQREFIMHAHGMDFIPSSIELAELETRLLNTISRETILKKIIVSFKQDYDYVLLDGMPSLNILTVCTLTAADCVLIPTQPQFFSIKGIELLLSTIASVKENLNPDLTIEGALVTMYDNRLSFAREVLNTLVSSYSRYFKIFDTKIPMSVRVTESQAQGRSIFDTDSTGKIAAAYDAFAKELIGK